MGAEKCTLLIFSQKRIYEDWILEIDCWLIKFDRWPLSEVLDQSITMLGRSGKTKDRDAGGLIFRKLSKDKRDQFTKR